MQDMNPEYGSIWKSYIVHVLEQLLSLVGRARAGRIVRKIYLDAGKKSDFSIVAKIE